MTCLTAYNAVQHFNMLNGEEIFGSNEVKKLKKSYLQMIDTYMLENGIKAYAEKAKDIMSYLVHITCVTGVQAVSRDTIAKWTNTHKTTVSKVIKRLVSDGLFTVGYLNDTHKGHYVVLFRLHEKYQQAMKELFDIEVDKLSTENEQESTQSDIQEQQATSSATTEATSSGAENPCGSKAEASKNVSTIHTTITCSFEEDKEDIYISSTQLSDEQELHAELIKQNDKILEAYKVVAEEIVATMPEELDEVEFEAFGNLFRNQMTTVVPKYDPVALFKKMFKNEVAKVKQTKLIQEQVQNAIQNKGNFTFYNWLTGQVVDPDLVHNRRANKPVYKPVSNKPFSFYNWVTGE